MSKAKLLFVFASFFMTLFWVQSSSADEAKQYVVGTDVYNLFEFPSPIREAVLPEGMEVADEPRYVNGNKGVLLNFKYKDPSEFQVVFMLRNGATHMVSIHLDQDAGGHTHRIGDFSSEVDRRAGVSTRNPNSDFLKVMSEKLSDLAVKPKGFVEGDLPPARMFEGEAGKGEPVGVALTPVERLTGHVEGRRVHLDLFYVDTTSGVSPARLDPSQFAGKDIAAITVTRDAEGKHYVLLVKRADS